MKRVRDGHRAAWLGLVLLAGCAGSGVSPALIAAFPPEGRRASYEAENEVIIALDRLDEARDRAVALERKVDTYPETEHAPAVHAARRAWFEAELAEAEAEVEVATEAVACARRALVLTQARLAVRFDLPVEEGFVKPFESAFEDCQEDLAEAQAEADAQEKSVRERRDAWRKARADHAARTGDWSHGLWID